MRRAVLPAAALLLLLPLQAMSQRPDGAPVAAPDSTPRPRARDIGLVVGIFPTGANNAITDVSGVRVGHATVVEGDRVRTGVTAILPHAGNPYRSRVPAALVDIALGPLIRVAESGIKGPADVARLHDAGWHAFLVGEHLVRSEDPAAEVARLRDAR